MIEDLISEPIAVLVRYCQSSSVLSVCTTDIYIYIYIYIYIWLQEAKGFGDNYELTA